ncbi:Unknown protein, partial [Striga hermonthica]
ATFDPGDSSISRTFNAEFPPLDRESALTTKRHKTLKRSGDTLEPCDPPRLSQPPPGFHGHPPTSDPPTGHSEKLYTKWTFRDMVNKHRNHVEVVSDDEGQEDDREDFVVDLDRPLPEMTIPQRFFDQVNLEWKNVVVVKPFDESLTMASLYNRLTKMWPAMAGCNMMDLENGFYLIHLQTIDDAIQILTGGPYVVGSSYMHVQPWSLDFDAMNEELTSTVAWIRLPGLPAHLYHKKIFRTIGKIVGKVVKIDHQTAALTRGKYARLAVMVDLTKPL